MYSVIQRKRWIYFCIIHNRSNNHCAHCWARMQRPYTTDYITRTYPGPRKRRTLLKPIPWGSLLSLAALAAKTADRREPTTQKLHAVSQAYKVMLAINKYELERAQLRQLHLSLPGPLPVNKYTCTCTMSHKLQIRHFVNQYMTVSCDLLWMTGPVWTT